MKDKIERVQRALDAFRQGKIILVRDDEDRENEGDFVCSLDHATPENIAFMAIHGRGLICASISESTAERLNLGPSPRERAIIREPPLLSVSMRPRELRPEFLPTTGPEPPQFWPILTPSPAACYDRGTYFPWSQNLEG